MTQLLNEMPMPDLLTSLCDTERLAGRSSQSVAAIRRAVELKLESAVAAERERCKRLLCPHCKLGKPLQHAASGWRHSVAGIYVPCRAAALQEGGAA